jgi:hypothetical protein
VINMLGEKWCLARTRNKSASVDIVKFIVDVACDFILSDPPHERSLEIDTNFIRRKISTRPNFGNSYGRVFVLLF